MNKFEGKVIIVTGASSGIGREIAETLRWQKATIVLVARRQKLLQECAKTIASANCIAKVIPTDLRDHKQIASLVKTTVQEFGRIDVLINVASVGYYDWLEEQTYEELKEQTLTNILGTAELTRQVIPIMKSQRSGHILNFASYASQISTPPLTIYSMTKYAIEGLTDGLRRELAPWNIKVTRVHPSAVRTNFNNKAQRHQGIHYPYDSFTGVTKKDVAKKVINAIYHPKHAVFVAKWQIGVDLTVFINRYLPWIIDLVFRFRTPALWRQGKHDLQAKASGIKEVTLS